MKFRLGFGGKFIRNDNDHGTGPRRNGSVNSRSTLCPIERRSWLMLTKDASLSCHLAVYVAFYGVEKDRFVLNLK